MSEHKALDKVWQRQRSRRCIAYCGACILALVALLTMLRPFGFIGINWTDSIAGTFFWVDTTRRPTLGDIAAFYPPKGNRYADTIWFGKYIVGVAGDEVVFKDHQVFINGHAKGRVLLTASNGDPLEPATGGVIPPAHFFVWTPHFKSYDSRYKDIGLIHENDIFGRVVPVL